MAGGLAKSKRRGRRGGARASRLSEINVTPFVDVMLVLLIVFMVTAPLLTVSIPIELPKTDAKQSAAETEPLAITVRANGEIFLQETPVTIDDLAQHDCLQFILPSTGQRVPWQFRVDGRDLDLATRGGMCCSGDVQAQVTLAREGAGLAQVASHMAASELARGELVEVMAAHAGRSRPFSLLYPADRHMPQRLRVVVDHLLTTFGRQPVGHVGATA